MQKITNWIFNQSPKKLAIYLLIFPLIILIAHSALSIMYRNIVESDDGSGAIIFISMMLVISIFIIPFTIWMLWLKGAVLSVETAHLGLPLKWFRWAMIVFIVHLIFIFCFEFREMMPETVGYIFSMLSEGIRMVGLLVAYPIICHYAGRAVYVKKNKKEATFINSIVYTLLLIFIPICIPFLHHYFKEVEDSKDKLLVIYLIAGGIFICICIGAFFAALIGLI